LNIDNKSISDQTYLENMCTHECKVEQDGFIALIG